MTKSYDDIWAETAANLLGYIELLQSGEAQLHEAPVIMTWNLYLVTSLAYYKYDNVLNLMSDAWYDALCQFILVNVSAFRAEIRHPETLDVEQLQAGTGYAIDHDQPTHEIYYAVGRQLEQRRAV